MIKNSYWIRKMIKKLALLALVSVFAAQGQSAESTISAQSEKRFEKISKLVSDYAKSGENMADPDVKKAILNELASTMPPLTPKTPPDLRTSKDLSDEAKLIVQKKFPKTPDQCRSEATKEAAALFIMAKPMDKVQLQFRKGSKLYSVDGIFYSYGSNSINVGEYTIALFDLLPEYRVKFDPVYCETQKKDYINNKMQEYFQQKAAYSREVLWKLKEAQIAANEKAGYVMAWKEWKSVKDVAEILIRSQQENPDKASPEEKAEKKAASKKTEDQPQETAAVREEKPAAPTKAANLENELEEKANRQLKKIANTCSGIDADQGYKLALWNMTREEVRILMAKELGTSLTPVNDKEVDILNLDKGPIQKIEFCYFNNVFGRMVVHFRITNMSEMMELTKNLNDRYGLTDEQKKAMKEQEEAKKIDPAENADASPKDDKDKKDKKDKKKKEEEPPPPPLEQTFHWTGNITYGSIYLKLSPDRTSFQQLVLTKESAEVISTYKLQMQRKRSSDKSKESPKSPIDF